MAEKEIQSDEVEYEPLESEEVERYSKTTHIYCNPCLEGDENNEAEGFCVDCNDYLCSECFRAHHKNRSSKHHVLKNKADAPAVRSQVLHKFEKCIIHEKEILEYYCHPHKLPLCKLCKETHHRRCGNVVDLADILHEETKADVLQGVRDELRKLQKKFDSNLCILKQNKASCETYYQNAIRSMRMIPDRDIKMMAAIETACKTSNSQIITINKNFENFENNDKLKLLVTLNAKAQLTTLKQTLVAIEFDNKIDRYFFEPKTASYGYGVGVLQKCPLQLEQVCVKTTSDQSTCTFTGIEILSDKRLVVADNSNQKIKLVDKTGKNVISELKLGFSIWDITRINDQKIAVTTHIDKKILLVSITDTLTVQKTIDKSGFASCRGILFCDDTLFVSYHGPNQIEKVNLEGTVQHTKDNTDGDWSSLSGDIQYITSNPDANALYLSDTAYNKIHCVSLDGQIISNFTHQQLRSPRGIAAGRDGRIFVCSYSTNKIIEIAYDLSKCHILLDENYGISQPHSIKYSDEECKLFIGSESKDTIQVFLV